MANGLFQAAKSRDNAFTWTLGVARGVVAVVGPARRTIAEARLHQVPARPHLSPADIERVVAALGDIWAVLAAADPAKKAETYAELGVTLTYRPDENTATAEARPRQNQDMYVRTCPRSELNRLPTPVCCPPGFSLVARHDRAGRPVDPTNHHRMRRAAGPDRGHCLLPAHA